MKKGIVKYSKEFKTLTGNVWLGIENEYDMGEEGSFGAFKRAEEAINQYAVSVGLASLADTPSAGSPIYAPAELPVIDKAEERMGILIENSETMEELLIYKDETTTPYLASIFAAKLSTIKNNK